MASKTKLIVTGSCRFEGQHLAKGATFDVDLNAKPEAQRLAPLVHAGRVATCTPEVERAIKAEIASEKEIERTLANVGDPKKE